MLGGTTQVTIFSDLKIWISYLIWIRVSGDREKILKLTVSDHYIVVPAVPIEDRIFFIQKGWLSSPLKLWETVFPL